MRIRIRKDVDRVMQGPEAYVGERENTVFWVDLSVKDACTASLSGERT